jgi:predicted nucleotidyltransferase component of viral defense system
MIDSKEIDDKAAELDIHTSNVQRDYVFGWFLAGIYTVSELRDELVLKGGNCFRKAYFPNTRYSNDLDFSVQTGLQDDYVRGELNKVSDFVTDAAGVKFLKEKCRVAPKKHADKDKHILEARVYFNDFYGEESSITISIRLDITQFDRVFLPAQSRHIIHPYSDRDDCSAMIRCVKLEEALASKLKCLLQRRHSSDIYDYVHWLFFEHEIEVNKSEILTALLRMTIFGHNPGVLRGLLIGLPFAVFKVLWDKYLVCPKPSRFDFDPAVEKFKLSILDLFKGIPLGGESLAFFPAAYRNPILEAGAGMKLMEVVYDGIPRIVEPYSLAYKTRKDGVSREYFYVWDRTGGRSGQTGVKSFVAEEVQSMKVLDETFEPRYEIELRKAGEPARSGYFGKPFSTQTHAPGYGTRSTGPRSSRTFSRQSFGPTYVLECSICGKKFRRKTSNRTLNRHKDHYGNDCYGRMGYHVDTLY